MDKNLITSTTALAMHITKQYLSEGDAAIDATCGNGQDTLELVSAVGNRGFVLALDIQEKAVKNTEKLITEHGVHPHFGIVPANVAVVRGSFENLISHWKKTGRDDAPKAIIFNLGYLPGGDKHITTEKDVTMRGLQAAVELVASGGIVTVVMYSGHEQGKAEKRAVMEWAGALPTKKFHVIYTDMLNQPNDPPEILWITKK